MEVGSGRGMEDKKQQQQQQEEEEEEESAGGEKEEEMGRLFEMAGTGLPANGVYTLHHGSTVLHGSMVTIRDAPACRLAQHKLGPASRYGGPQRASSDSGHRSADGARGLRSGLGPFQLLNGLQLQLQRLGAL
ncbi:hypothetical protein EYF80_024236 [Liparis tanakae]|uniref:Uncharacterized protein n=1 Tax=Liparis tanakae TaxID=230148 RepID=A0A4Z2HIA6_9TELE|nr:hypothetical protein EYF80_024236 [Liparis tanakae]